MFKNDQQSQPVVTLAQIATEVGWPDAADHVFKVAEALGIVVTNDWANRRAVSTKDAGQLWRHYQDNPLQDPALRAAAREDTNSRIGESYILDKHNQLVSSTFLRPGENE